MKKGLLICVALAICTFAWAQNERIARIGVIDGNGSELLQPQTTLYVDIAIEKQEIIAGPYARYAQKYLGITAPLTDKVLYEIKLAKIAKTSILTSKNEVVNSTFTSHTAPEHGFPKLPIDRTSAAAPGLEESARLAANKIFEIRNNRYELITGEAGENVFGAGMAAAIAELKRLEEEYISLFLGKQTTTTESKHYEILPTEGTFNYMVCRFSATEGAGPKDFLSGMPVVLDLKPLETATASGLATTAKSGPKTSAFRIAADVECRIVFEGSELVSAIIPVFQLGQTVYVTQ